MHIRGYIPWNRKDSTALDNRLADIDIILREFRGLLTQPSSPVRNIMNLFYYQPCADIGRIISTNSTLVASITVFLSA